MLLYRDLPAAAVEAGIDAALRVGSVDPEVVAIESRRTLDTTSIADEVVVPIGVACEDRGAPTLDRYDTLLAGGAR